MPLPTPELSEVVAVPFDNVGDGDDDDDGQPSRRLRLRRGPSAFERRPSASDGRVAVEVPAPPERETAKRILRRVLAMAVVEEEEVVVERAMPSSSSSSWSSWGRCCLS